MEIASPFFTRWICAGLVMALLTPPAALAGDEKQDQKQDAASTQQSQAPQTGSPDSGTTSPSAQSQPAQTSDQLPDSPDTVRPQTNDSSQPPPAMQQQPGPAQPVPSKNQKPVGAAAAEVQSPTGEAAFKPAGAAIAPAKQRRTRMLLFKVGALIGAGVAIGSVAALSSASPSRPPGSH